MSREASGGRGGDTNAPIIQTDQAGQVVQPRSLLDAISDIQQYYVVEGKGQDIPGEFLTLGRSLDFFKVGMRSGFMEGITLALLMPFFAFYLFPFVLTGPDMFTKIFFGSLPYIVLIVNTLLCSYIGRYYVGKITRKAINNLLSGRTLSLLIKGLLIYVFYLVLHRISTPERVWNVTQHLGSWDERLYYGYLQVLPEMTSVATEIAIIMAIGAVVPYATVYFLDIWTRFKTRRNLQSISAK